MTVEIAEITRTETTAYGISFVVCTNKETNRDTLGLGLEPTDEVMEEAAIDAAENAAIEAIQAAGCDCLTESFFARELSR